MKQKQIENFADIIKKSWIFKIFPILRNQILLEAFLKIGSFKNLSWGQVRSHKNVSSIGSAVLTFIGYKQADTQTDKQCMYI